MTNAAFWDKLAPRYAAQPIDDVPAYEETIAVTAAYLSPEDRVLEIGCGTGGTALTLAQTAREVVATDVSQGMISIAKSKLTANTPNVSFKVASSDEILDEAPFQAICAFNILHLVDDPKTTITALSRQVDEGGLIISKTPCMGEGAFFMPAIIWVMRQFGKAPFVHVMTGDQLEAMFHKAGFEILERRKFWSGKINPFIVARKSS